MSEVSGILRLPEEVFEDIITHLVISIGIYRAVILRRVNRRMNTAIMHTICVRRVIDLQHSATPGLFEYMPASMRAEILLQPGQLPETDLDLRMYMAVVAFTNRALDKYSVSDDEPEHAGHLRHRLIAENICILHWRRAWKFELVTSNVHLDKLAMRREYHPGKIYRTEWWRQPPDLEDRTLQAQNLFSAAILSGDVRVVETLLKEYSQACSPIQTYWTPFFYRPLVLAATTGNLELVKYLLSAGFRLDHNEDIVHEYNGTDTFHLEWDLRCIDRYDGCPSMNAARYEVPENLEWCSIAIGESHPLLAAVANQHTDIIHLFLQDEIKLRRTDDIYRRAILIAAYVGRPDLVELLLKSIHRSIADILQLDIMLVHFAVRGGHVEMVATLEKRGIDVTQQLLKACHADGSCANPLFRGQKFSSALQIAAFRGDLGMVEFLLLRQPDVNFKCWWQKKTPIEFAAGRGHLEIVKMLLDHDAKNLSFADPSAALTGASSTGQVNVMRYLLDRYPNLVDRDYEKSAQIGRHITGQRALIKATKSSNLAAITLLVQAGANPSHGQFSPMNRRNIPTGRRPL